MKVGDVCVVTAKSPHGVSDVNTRGQVGVISKEVKNNVFIVGGYMYFWNQLRPATFSEMLDYWRKNPNERIK